MLTKNTSKIKQDLQSEISKVFDKLPQKDYHNMAYIEKEISKVL